MFRTWSSRAVAALAAMVVLFSALPVGAATPPVVPFDDTGDLYLLDDGSDSILRVSGTTVSVAITEAQLDAVVPGTGVSLFNRDLAFDAAGNIYLTVGHDDTAHPPASLVKVDRGTGALSVLLGPEAALAAAGVPTATASELIGVAIGPDGFLYVNDSGTDSILKVDPSTGTPEKVVNRTELGDDPEIGGADLDGFLVVGSDGMIYVASHDNPPGVYRIDPDASTQADKIVLFANETGLNEVQTVRTNAAGGTFTLTYKQTSASPVEETAAIAWNASAATVEAAIEDLPSIGDVSVTGEGTLSSPWRVEFLGGENVSALGRGTETTLSPDGSRSFINVVQSPVFTLPNGITLDDSGNVYVADQAGADAQTIYKITPEGAVSAFVTTTEVRAVTGINGVDLDAGLAFDDTGNLWFGENESGSLLRFDATGANGTVVLSDQVLDAGVKRNDFRDATGTGVELKGGIEFAPVAAPAGDGGSTGGGTTDGGTTDAPGTTGGSSTPASGGYWFVGADGGIFSFGDAPFLGSTGDIRLNQPIVGMASRPGSGGYWFVARDGGIFSFGAPFLGSTGDIRLNQPIVGMAATPSGNGYWLVARDGGIFSFGDAEFLGSTGAIRLNQPIVGMAATPTGKGYWLVASDGGIFSFGDAEFFGSTGDIRLNQPIVGMAATPTGDGYWFVASDGGIFSFGDAPFLGSTGDIRLNQPIVGMAATDSGKGYRFVAADGGIFSFGDADFRGSTGDIRLNSPIVGMATAG